MNGVVRIRNVRPNCHGALNTTQERSRAGVGLRLGRAAARAQLLQIMAAEKMVGPRTGAGPWTSPDSHGTATEWDN